PNFEASTRRITGSCELHPSRGFPFTASLASPCELRNLSSPLCEMFMTATTSLCHHLLHLVHHRCLWCSSSPLDATWSLSPHRGQSIVVPLVSLFVRVSIGTSPSHAALYSTSRFNSPYGNELFILYLNDFP